MESAEARAPQKRRTRRCVISCVVALLLLVIVAVVLGLTLRTSEAERFESTFTARCEEFKGYDCQKIWGAFQEAYVGRDPCKVPMEAYDPFIAAAPFTPACNRMMFWSKTKDVAHDFTEKRDCFVTLEDTLLGSVLNDLTWCGKEGSKETFTSGCPGWTDCDNNTVRSFWNRVSTAFADAACGDATVMLNGSIAAPFSPQSIFGSIEVKRFNPAKMKSLNVVLVTEKSTDTNCGDASLQDLQRALAAGITYNCKEVSVSRVRECGSSTEMPCGACW